jgi:hypothetical protein
MKRLSLAFRCFFSLLFKGRISETLLAELQTRVAPPASGAATAPQVEPRPAEPVATAPARAIPAQPPPATGNERAIQMLALLQRDGRLIDFFTEDIAQYDDAQVGAAVRDMHESCRDTLTRYLTLKPVVPGEEGKPFTVDAGFDPGAIKLIGNVTGRLPASGTLRHHGWQAAEVRLPDVPVGATRSVIAPAEVEIS